MNVGWDLDFLHNQAKVKLSTDKRIIEEVTIGKNNLKVLDIGCSDGTLTYKLFSDNKFSRIIGIDVDERAIQLANQNIVDPKFQFFVEDIHAYDSAQKFDIIFLSYVLMHLKSPDKVLVKLKSMLTDNGIVIIKVPDDDYKIAYPDEENIIKQIFALYDDSIRPYQRLSKYTDRYIGKKVYSYMLNAGYHDIDLKIRSRSTAGMTISERQQFFDNSIAFRQVYAKHVIPRCIDNEMETLLNKANQLFLDPNFLYITSTFYYIASI